MTTEQNIQIYEYYKQETLVQGLFVLLDSTSFFKLLERSIVYLHNYQSGIKGLLVISRDANKHYITLHYGDAKIKEKLFKMHLNVYPKVELWIHFFNPDCLFWYPKKGILHPCMQGVLEGSDEERLYLELGFLINSTQETYYKDLSDFKMSCDVLKIFDDHVKSNITYVFYDDLKHHGLHTFTDQLDAPHWKDMILSNNAGIETKPLLIALKNDKIVGFAGPLGVDSSKRGTFSGIGVVASERGQKIGTVLFFELCLRLKSMGAEYMTLFTGDTNPARNIYLAAGFDIVARCVTLKYIP